MSRSTTNPTTTSTTTTNPTTTSRSTTNPRRRPRRRTEDPADLLAPWGWGDRVAALFAEVDRPGDVPARVTRVDNTHAQLQTAHGPLAVALASFPDPDGGEPLTPTTGDWVALHAGTDEATDPPAITAVVPRWSRLVRNDALGRTDQVLAADVDVVFVVHGLDRPLHAGRIERTMALAWDGGAVPVVVATKVDLVDTDVVDALVGDLERIAGGVDVVLAAPPTGRGIDELADHLRPDRTAALLGESGAGKSTLVNALVGADAAAVGRVRTGDAKGRHTTVSRDLFVVPSGGVVVDTPGLRAVGLVDAWDGVAQVFADVEAVAEGCRFRDCSHRGEPGCAVTAAVLDGALAADRVARYLALADELASTEQQRVEAERQRRRAGRQQARAARSLYRIRPGGRQKRR
ncbi:MAG: ribosome small subunit-dependent GTPase A [Acidimicrobiales bacterium]